MYHEFSTDPKVQMLSEVDQRRFVMLLCLRCCNGDVTLHETEVAFQLRISDSEWEGTKTRLLERGLITEENKPTNWDKRQFVSDTSNLRVKKFREKQKKRECNVTVTPPDTDTDTDTEVRDNTNVSSLSARKPKNEIAEVEEVKNEKNRGSVKKHKRLYEEFGVSTVGEFVKSIPQRWADYARAENPNTGKRFWPDEYCLQQLHAFWDCFVGSEPGAPVNVKEPAKRDWWLTWKRWCDNERSQPSAAASNRAKSAATAAVAAANKRWG